MKNIFCLTLLLFSSLFGSAQVPGWEWAQSCGNTREEIGVSAVTDKAGYVYTAGTFTSSDITFGTTVLVNNFTPQKDIFLVKYTPEGNVVWAKCIDNVKVDEVTGLAIDPNANLIVAGDFGGDTLIIGADTLINNGINARDILLVKYDSSGNPLWARSEGGYSNEYAYAVATDQQGNIFITGNYYTPTFNFDSVTITSSGDFDIFIAKYTPNGTFEWIRTSGGLWNDDGFGIATDSSGNVYSAGWFASDSITFGNTTLHRAGSGNFDVYLVKFTNNGNFEWATMFGSSARESLRSMVIDLDQNVYIAGEYTSDMILFAQDTLINSDTTIQTYDTYIASYDANGNERWARSINGTEDDYLYSICSDPSGHILVCGTFTSPTFYSDSIAFTNLGNANTGDLFIMKLDLMGNFIWGKSEGGSLQDFANSITVSNAGEIYVTGGFYSPSIIIGNDSLTDASTNSDYFVAKLGNSTGIIESGSKIELSLAPNPTTGYSKLLFSSPKISANSVIRIMDITGREIISPIKQTGQNSRSLEINLSDKPRGTYFVQLISGNSSVTKKIVLQ